MFEIEEDKPASKSSDTSDTTNVTFYAIGVIAAVAVAGMMIRNRIHKSKWILKCYSLSKIFFAIYLKIFIFLMNSSKM